jgi:electron transfer flavoprotein-quinone oxidoreductase
VGVVLHVPSLAAQDRRPEDLIADLKAHPAIAPLVEGGELKEYSAHLIPEAGWDMMPELGCPGLLVTGDAAALCLAAGIWLEGVNFAMGSGMVAAQVIDRAAARGTVAGADLPDRYREALAGTFVLQDHRKLRGAHHLVLSDRVQRQYPNLATNAAERMFRVDNPDHKPGLRHIVRDERRRAGLRLRDIARDAYRAWRAFG